MSTFRVGDRVKLSVTRLDQCEDYQEREERAQKRGIVTNVDRQDRRYISVLWDGEKRDGWILVVYLAKE